MFEKELMEIISNVKGLNEEYLKAGKKRQAELIKPPGSLGNLEDIAIRLCGIQSTLHPKMDKKRVIVLAADNGVVAENVSISPDIITTTQCINMTRHKTGMSAMALSFGDEVEVIDMGVNRDLPPEIINEKIRYGTGNILKEPAMTRDEVIRAIGVGIKAAGRAQTQGVKAIGIGEMGIGNTTTSTAVLSVLTGMEPKLITGYGGGLTDEGLLHKINVIEKAIAFHNPKQEDVIDVISKVGGLDIAAMCGVYLGCGVYRVSAVCDGFISIVAALCAARICERVKDFIFLSHSSVEPGYMAAAKELGLETPLSLHLRLGEGSGAVVMFRILEAATSMHNGMATFSEGDIDDTYMEPIRESGFADKR